MEPEGDRKQRRQPHSKTNETDQKEGCMNCLSVWKIDPWASLGQTSVPRDRLQYDILVNCQQLVPDSSKPLIPKNQNQVSHKTSTSLSSCTSCVSGNVKINCPSRNDSRGSFFSNPVKELNKWLEPNQPCHIFRLKSPLPRHSLNRELTI